MQEIARDVGPQIHVTIYGRADQTGAESKNAALSKERAERVLEALRERGIAARNDHRRRIGRQRADSARLGPHISWKSIAAFRSRWSRSTRETEQ